MSLKIVGTGFEDFFRDGGQNLAFKHV